MTEALALQ